MNAGAHYGAARERWRWLRVWYSRRTHHGGTLRRPSRFLDADNRHEAADDTLGRRQPRCAASRGGRFQLACGSERRDIVTRVAFAVFVVTCSEVRDRNLRVRNVDDEIIHPARRRIARAAEWEGLGEVMVRGEGYEEGRGDSELHLVRRGVDPDEMLSGWNNVHRPMGVPLPRSRTGMGTCIVLREKQRIYKPYRDEMELYYFNNSDVSRMVPESMEGGWCFNEVKLLIHPRAETLWNSGRLAAWRGSGSGS